MNTKILISESQKKLLESVVKWLESEKKDMPVIELNLHNSPNEWVLHETETIIQYINSLLLIGFYFNEDQEALNGLRLKYMESIAHRNITAWKEANKVDDDSFVQKCIRNFDNNSY